MKTSLCSFISPGFWLSLVLIFGLGLPESALAQDKSVADLEKEVQELRTELDTVKKEVEKLKADNLAIHKYLAAQAAASRTNALQTLPKTSSTTNSALQTTAPAPAPPPAAQQAYWLSTGNIRHNSRCRYYKKSQGKPCGPNDGVPCKICGG